MSKNLHQIAVITSPALEESVVQLLEERFQQTPAIYLELATGLSTISVYQNLPPSRVAATRAVLREDLRILTASLAGSAKVQIRIRKVPAQDWSESWKRHFKPMELGPSLLVKPTWSRRRPKKNQAVVLLDPGLSFGTGQHATTRFCLEQLVAHRKPDTEQSLLDAGMGSGILAIAASKLGYSPVEAFDFDPEAVRIAQENAELNQVSAAVKIQQADLTKLPKRSRERFDVVCANLIYDLLISERDRLLARVKPGGILILAGILETQFRKVSQAFAAAGVKCVRSQTEKEWRSGTFRVGEAKITQRTKA